MKGAGQMFEIGDVVVYPIHGVARVLDIKKEKIGDSDQLCYILETEINKANTANKTADRQSAIQSGPQNSR